MKKTKLSLLLMFLLLFPFCVFLSGCGATPVNSIKKVSFVSDMYINDKAVYELDLNKPFKLPYKINPSSAYGYAPRFTPISGVSGVNRETFNFDLQTGIFCIIDEKFNDVEVEIYVGDYKDVCIVTLKKYPIQIGLYDENEFNCINEAPTLNMACGTAYQIPVAGVFSDSAICNQETNERVPQLLKGTEYHFLVEADENSRTLVNIPNKNRLTFTTYGNYGTAKVDVSLLNTYDDILVDEEGNEIKFTITINVFMPCNEMSMKLSGSDRIVFSNDESQSLMVYSSNLSQDDQDNYIVEFEAKFYDANTKLIEDKQLSVVCFVSDAVYVDVDNMQNKIIIKKPGYANSLAFKLTFWSNAVLSNGQFCIQTIDLTIKF